MRRLVDRLRREEGVAMILVAATLESVFAICLGCKIFAVLMRRGVIPASVCAECGDLSKRLGAVG